jgi:hypothetical protein
MTENDMERDTEQQQNRTIATTTYVRTGKPGHPSKYTPTAVRRLLAAIADGMTNKAACVAANIGVATLRDWRKEHPDLELRMEEAREKARQKALRRIKTAAEQGDWRADAEWLKLTFPQDYRRSGSQPTTQTNNTQINAVVLPPEVQDRLNEQRRRILATLPPEQRQQLETYSNGHAVEAIITEPEQRPVAEPEQPAANKVEQQQPATTAIDTALLRSWMTARNSYEDAEEPIIANDGVPRLR